MADTNITYRVTGRYMSGPSVEAYHLVGDDGKQIVANRDRILFLIGHGQIENMRIQFSDGEAIIRGRGINLNTLPIYDLSKREFRGNSASQSAANTGVNTRTNNGGATMGQYTIIKRIMAKNNCIGYVLRDMSGKEIKIQRQKALELAHSRLISNAVVNRFTPNDGSAPKIILRGVNCNLNELPIIAVDQKGNIIDPSVVAKQNTVYMRAAKMSRGGIIYDKRQDKKLSFGSGDYILCGVNGTLRPVRGTDAVNLFTISKDSDSAVCDEFLQNLEYYPIELFGGSITTLNESQVKRWPIVKVTKRGA